MPDLSDLISRVEKASGPDDALDFEILCLVDPRALRSGPLRGDPKYTASLDAVLTLLPEGFWWRGGTCSVSSEATVCPDHNGPHRERLLRECPPTELIWDEGVETELRPGSNNALIRALLSAILRARQAMQMEARK